MRFLSDLFLLLTFLNKSYENGVSLARRLNDGEDVSVDKRYQHKYMLPTFEINVKSIDAVLDESNFLKVAETYMKQKFETNLPVGETITNISLFIEDDLDLISSFNSYNVMEPKIDDNKKNKEVAYTPFYLNGFFQVESLQSSPLSSSENLARTLTLEAFDDVGKSFLKMLQSSSVFGNNIKGISFQMEPGKTELDKGVIFEIPTFEISIKTKKRTINVNYILEVTQAYMKGKFEQLLAGYSKDAQIQDFVLRFEHKFMTSPIIFFQKSVVPLDDNSSSDIVYYIPLFISGEFRANTNFSVSPKWLTRKAFDDFGVAFLELIQNKVNDGNYIDGVSFKNTADHVADHDQFFPLPVLDFIQKSNLETNSSVEAATSYIYQLPTFEISIRTKAANFNSKMFLSTVRIHLKKIFQEKFSTNNQLEEINLLFKDDYAGRFIVLQDAFDQGDHDESQKLGSSNGFYLNFVMEGDLTVTSSLFQKNLGVEILKRAFQNDVLQEFEKLLQHVDFDLDGISFQLTSIKEGKEGVEKALDYFSNSIQEEENKPLKTYSYTIPTFEVTLETLQEEEGGAGSFDTFSFLTFTEVYMKKKMMQRLGQFFNDDSSLQIQDFSLSFLNDLPTPILFVDTAQCIYSSNYSTHVNQLQEQLQLSSFLTGNFSVQSTNPSFDDSSLARKLTLTTFDDFDQHYLNLLQYTNANIETVSFKIESDASNTVNDATKELKHSQNEGSILASISLVGFFLFAAILGILYHHSS